LRVTGTVDGEMKTPRRRNYDVSPIYNSPAAKLAERPPARNVTLSITVATQ